MLIPLFPDLMPKVTEFPWFRVDVPRDEAAEIEAAETAHQNWLNGIGHREFNVAPIGKTQAEAQLANGETEQASQDEDEEDDEEDVDNDNEDDDSDTTEDDDDVDMDFNPTPTILNTAPAELNPNRANIARH